MTFSELEDNWNTYSCITVTEGRVRLNPCTKVNTKAINQWFSYMIRLNEDSINFTFPVKDQNDLIERYNTHKQWKDDA